MKRKVLPLLTVSALLALSPTSGHGNDLGYTDGHELLSKCQSASKLHMTDITGEQMLDALECGNFVAGVFRANTIYAARVKGQREHFFCPPDEHNNMQLADLVSQYLRQNRDKLYLPSEILTYETFLETWPCKE